MFDSVSNVNDYLSEHWLAEVFPNKLKDLAKGWKELASQGKDTPIKGLSTISGSYLTTLGKLPEPTQTDYVASVTDLHRMLLSAVGFDSAETVLETFQGETPIAVPLLGRFASATATDALQILQAVPAIDADGLFSADAELISPLQLSITSAKIELLGSVSKAVTQLFVSDNAPRYLLVVAGSVVLLTDAARWSEGRYLAFDIATALDRRDEKATGELAHHAGLWSADVLLPNDDGKTALDAFTEDSEKHAVGVSEDLREGLRISIERIANEVLDQRRAGGRPVNGIPELPRELTIQSLRFLYRILFLLFAEARPELGILPVGAPEYGSGYGLDRLREITQVPLTGKSAGGHHLHESLNLLFRLVNDGHGADNRNGDGLVFEAMRSDLFDPARTPLIDDAKISNKVLQEVLTLLLLSKPSKNKNKQRGYISYAQLGINQLGAVYEGLMSYSGLIADDDMVEVAKDGNADKGSWLVPSTKSGDYDAGDIVWREDRLTGRKDIVRHPKGSFVFRLSGRDRQRSASYYTPEVLTKTVVKHSLAELITEETTAADILKYRICEPALGSGAFLNEAINQLSAEYLTRRQNELGDRIQPENYATELQKVKAYLALHRAYGVDLNATAVELAEVSLWLNVMHKGLQAPWFGLHLRRGNSLIGARRATYDFTSLGRAKKSWLKTPPTDRPLAEGPIGDGEIHHFLLPADGWAAVADAKQAKELAPEAAAALKKWRAEVTKKPSAKQLDRLRALSRRVERLWELALRRLEISEREVSRHIDVWGAEIPAVQTAATREQVESELLDPEGPYMRLRLAMDVWCAMWFWPLTGSVEDSDHDDDHHPGPPNLDEWMTTLEELLGADGLRKGATDQGMFHETVESFDQLSKMDELERSFYGMRPVWLLVSNHEWLGTARNISDGQGFFHWELDFAPIFRRGGFDVQVGNPPWVRPDWWESTVLSEFDPYFSLQSNISESVINARRMDVLHSSSALDQYLGDLASWAGAAENLGSKVEYPTLAGVRTNLYMNFMERVWRNLGGGGIAGLIHPESHFSDPKAGNLRAETYSRLRRHWQFLNGLFMFEGVSDKMVFGISIYGCVQEPNFLQMSYLQNPLTLEASLVAASDGEIPGIQYAWGGWDFRPHLSRLAQIDRETLTDWVKLFDEPGVRAEQARLLRPLTREHIEILSVFSAHKLRLSDIGYRWSSLWNEKTSKQDGYIEWKSGRPEVWGDVVYQGPHFTVGNPFAKEPNENCKNNSDYALWDLEELSESMIPRTNYQRACDREAYDAGIPVWGKNPAIDYWRVAWRDMTQPGLERSLHAALLPPGAAHVHTIRSMAVGAGVGKGDLGTNFAPSLLNTALIAGLLASLPYDYLIKVSGTSAVNMELLKRVPAPVNHAAYRLLLLRTLRLNCVTQDYAPLWEALFQASFETDSWTDARVAISSIGVAQRTWTMDTPLRTDLERRAALVEIDALAALMLGLTAEHLGLIFRAQFPVLRKYEYEMYFDSRGRKIAKDHHAQGAKQQKEDYKLLQEYFDGEDSGDLLDRYKPFPPDDNHDEPWFYKPDREAEMRIAYAEFERRLGLNG
ncbi:MULTISPECIES: Eco57I restriction-modification methylase domain-containing protein [unclassified Rhodococcus (in: high G+C Gram-positive bacteria)]|uniref:Eco57I restriction-modification methylase domain-containing protein n=1 Tax=unclassified Rhodococcus (in: high G+C Gram-positive bacteria) TaxID=192944 RepID=UPI00096AA228|nr:MULTISPECIES: restriction endonuclease subunit M [unclassified Rhodococcus (in: high G+C Gram-positive bacteria)]